MGGQDGYSRDVLSYNEESNNIMAGIKIRPSDRWDIGLNLAYTAAEGGLAPFDLPANEYVDITPVMSYDFSNSNTYSNIDVTRFNFDAMLKYKFTEDLWMRLWYKIVDYDDEDPYLYDTTGMVQWATITAGWNF